MKRLFLTVKNTLLSTDSYTNVARAAQVTFTVGPYSIFAHLKKVRCVTTSDKPCRKQ